MGKITTIKNKEKLKYKLCLLIQQKDIHNNFDMNSLTLLQKMENHYLTPILKQRNISTIDVQRFFYSNSIHNNNNDNNNNIDLLNERLQKMESQYQSSIFNNGR